MTTATDADFRVWLDRVKGVWSAARVAEDLGLTGSKKRFFCPACQPNGGKTPDLSPRGQLFKCFKCGAGGSVIDLVLLKRGGEFLEAANWLADRAGIEQWRGGVVETSTATAGVRHVGQLPGAGHAPAAAAAAVPHGGQSPGVGHTSPKKTGERKHVSGRSSAAPVAAAANRAHAHGIRDSLRPARDARPTLLQAYQAALPGSLGERYLKYRRISLDLAQAHGLGYAVPGTWLGRDWKGGRLVVPHTDPDGGLVSFYGRAVGTDDHVPKGTRHDHLAGAKGIFNAPALRDGEGPVYVTEGAFDALALMAAGVDRVVAIFGKSGWRWGWARDVSELVLAFDADAAPDARALAREALLRGRRVSILPPEAYGGHKDVAAAWAAGELAIDTEPGAQLPEDRQAEWAERAALRQC